MQAVQMPPAAWDVNPITEYEVKLEGLNHYQVAEVRHAIQKNPKLGYFPRLIQRSRQHTKSTFVLRRSGDTAYNSLEIDPYEVPFEFSICNVCHTALCEHKEGRSDWPAK